MFHRSKIQMTHIFLNMWVYSGLSEWMYLAQIPCGNSPTDLSVCSTLLENILNFHPVSAVILTIKVRAHASVRRLEIMWAVLMSVTFWPCHTYQNKLLVHLSLLISCFILGSKGRMNTCVISSCLFAYEVTFWQYKMKQHCEHQDDMFVCLVQLCDSVQTVWFIELIQNSD